MSPGRSIAITVSEHGFNKVATNLNKINTIGDRVNAGFKRMTSGIKAFARSALITTAVITGLVYAASRLSRAILTPFMSLETTMTRVGIAAGATIEQIEMMTNVVSRLGRETHFTATEAAEGMFYLAKAGLSVQQSVDAIPGVLQAALIEELDLGTAADIVTGLLNEFSLAANRAGFAADVLAKGSNLAKTNMPEMSEALKYFGTTAHEMGYNIQQAVAMLDVLAGKMIRGSMAGTAMRQSMLLFQKVQASGLFVTKAQIDAINRLGLDAGTMAKQIKSGDLTFMKFIGTLKKAGATTGDFASIFEQRAAVAVNALAEAAETSFPKYVDELNNAVGFTAKATEALADTLDEQMRQIKSSIEGFTNTLAESVAPALQDFLEHKLRPFINGMTEAWKNGGDTIKDKIQSVADFIAPTFRSGIEEAIDTIKELAPSLGREIGAASLKIAIEILKGAYGALSQLRYGVPIGGWNFQNVEPPAGTFTSPGEVRISDITGLVNYLGRSTIKDLEPYNPLPETGWQELIDLLKTLPDSFTAKVVAMSYPEIAARITPRPLIPFGSDQTTSLAFGTLSSVINDLSFAVRGNTDAVGVNTVAVESNTNAVDGKDQGSFWDSAVKDIGKWGSDLVAKGAEALVGGIEGVLIGSVVDPIIGALTDYLAPTMDKLEKLFTKILRVFDPLIFLIEAGIDVFMRLLGGPDYTEGRYTGAGAYQVNSYTNGGIAATPQLAMVAEAGPEIILPLQPAYAGGYGGIAMSSGGVHIEHIEVNGRDAEDAGDAIVEEISRHEELTTRQIARSLQQGMLKREAMER